MDKIQNSHLHGVKSSYFIKLRWACKAGITDLTYLLSSSFIVRIAIIYSVFTMGRQEGKRDLPPLAFIGTGEIINFGHSLKIGGPLGRTVVSIANGLGKGVALEEVAGLNQILLNQALEAIKVKLQVKRVRGDEGYRFDRSGIVDNAVQVSFQRTRVTFPHVASDDILHVIHGQRLTAEQSERLAVQFARYPGTRLRLSDNRETIIFPEKSQISVVTIYDISQKPQLRTSRTIIESPYL
jgi:hypothetical protein